MLHCAAFWAFWFVLVMCWCQRRCVWPLHVLRCTCGGLLQEPSFAFYHVWNKSCCSAIVLHTPGSLACKLPWFSCLFPRLLMGMLGVRCTGDSTSSFCVDLRSELRLSELYGKGLCPLSHVLGFPNYFKEQVYYDMIRLTTVALESLDWTILKSLEKRRTWGIYL